MNQKINDAQNIFLFGIGGSGMSALAGILAKLGKNVTGSDISYSRNIQRLMQSGISVSIGQNIEGIQKDTHLVIYSLAVASLMPDFLKEVDRMFATCTYAEALGALSTGKKNIVVSGTHGKTTTTAMLGTAMLDLQLSPTIVLGGFLAREKTNFTVGTSDLYLIEGCEYKRSFLNLTPSILIISNIEADHLDYFKDLDDTQAAFKELVDKVDPSGYIICNTSDPVVSKVVKSSRANICNYMDYYDDSLNLSQFGEYNLQNAAIVKSVGAVLGLDQEELTKSLENFHGVARRCEYKGTLPGGALVYDDYAHHPTEVQSFLEGVRARFPNRKIVAIFEPHLFSRTRTFFRDFVDSFGIVDRLIIPPIYPARETNDGTISSQMLVDAISGKHPGVQVLFLPSYTEIVTRVRQHDNKDTIILTIGAGSIYQVGESLIDPK